MAFGDHPCDAALRSAWHRFCEELKLAGDRVFKPFNPPHPLQRADSFRFLTQNLGQAFDLALETRDPAWPQIHAFCTPTRKLGGDAADLTYRQAWIDGSHRYVLRGRRGTARFFNVAVQGERPEFQPGTGYPSLHEPFGDLPEANVFGHQLECSDDGTFEIFVGGERSHPNWLPTTPASRKLFIREGFDRWDETPTTMAIERLGMDRPRPLPDPDAMTAAMDWASRFLTGMMRDWPDHPFAYGGGVFDPHTINAFPPDPPRAPGDEKRGRMVAAMTWELAADEALIVEFPAHDGFWMVTLGGAFMNSFDFLNRRVSATPSRTAVDDDGMIRLVLCAQDPGIKNWLDTQSFSRGHLIYRNFLSETVANFTTSTVPVADLMRRLPSSTALCLPDERIAEGLLRLRAVRQRYQAF